MSRLAPTLASHDVRRPSAFASRRVERLLSDRVATLDPELTTARAEERRRAGADATRAPATAADDAGRDGATQRATRGAQARAEEATLGTAQRRMAAGRRATAGAQLVGRGSHRSAGARCQAA